MKYRKPALLALALLAALGSALGTRAPAQWLEARSPHFVVISDAGEARARGVTKQFEHLRALLRRVLTNTRIDPRVPLVVLAVGSEPGLRELLPQYWEHKGRRPAGGYWKGPHRQYIVLRVDTTDRQRDSRVLHEYVHVLTHENIPDLPAWLDEGLAEFWATAVVQSDGVEIGRPPLAHLKALQQSGNWIPLAELLAAKRAPDAGDSKKLSMFYAQSWALTHYLMLRESATELELAPPTAFGDLSHVEQALAAYVRAGQFRVLRIPVSQPGPEPSDLEVRIRPLPAAESLVVRAGFLVDGERPAAALPLLKEALAADPNGIPALETLGYFHFQQNDPAEAARWFDRAIQSGSASYLAYFYRAILAGPVPIQAVGEGKTTAEAYLRSSIVLNPGFAEAYIRLADLYAQQDGRLDEALPLVQRATELEPDNASYQVDLEKLLLRLNH